jgi:hypothetical protein
VGEPDVVTMLVSTIPPTSSLPTVSIREKKIEESHKEATLPGFTFIGPAVEAQIALNNYPDSDEESSSSDELPAIGPASKVKVEEDSHSCYFKRSSNSRPKIARSLYSR